MSTGEELIYKLLGELGENPDREGLQETPARVMRAWQVWTSGYGEDPAAVLKCFEDGGEAYTGLVCQGGIPVYSHCEHHLAAFHGVAHVAYIPNGRIVGLSKLARVVNIFMRRLQVQERLTTQIADALWVNLKPRAVGVVLRCRHMCIESRGVERIGTVTYTNAMRGDFMEEPAAREEFLRFVERADGQLKL